MTKKKTNQIPDGWREVTLGSVAKVLSGSTPSTKNSSYWDGGIGWITPKDLSGFNGRFINTGERTISKEGLRASSAQLLPKNTILFSSRAPIGYVAIADCPLTTNQGFKNVECNEKDTHFKFIFYWLKRNAGFIERLSSGSTFSEATATVMRDLNILLPPLPEQKAIAAVLSSLDDKIELLRKQNETLEAIAQAIFKEWFVNFNFPDKNGKPYKDNGGKMIDSELGPIPHDWRMGVVGDEVDTLGGGTPSTIESSYWEDGTIPWYSPTDLTRDGSLFSLKTEKNITEAGLAKSSAKLFPKHSLLMSSRATIGAITINTFEACTNQGFIVIVPNETLPLEYLHGWLKTQIPDIKQIADGSTFPEIAKSVFRAFPITVPEATVMDKFKQSSGTIYKKCENNKRQIVTLTHLRDTLLPKLMSGQVRVKGGNKNY